MMFYLIFSLVLIQVEASLTEQNPFVFKPPDLSHISQELTGSETNWPIVFHSAEYRSGDNEFVMDAESLAEVARFRDNWALMDHNRSQYSELIKNGAGVFAAKEVARTDSIFLAFRDMIDKGNIEESIRLISDYNSSISEIQTALLENRVVDVEARLSEKHGQVEYRRGLIGQWLAAHVGRLFREADGIRTTTESTGKVTFLDGSEVRLSNNTTAIIRSSRLDRLTNISDVEIDINEGGLLARLSTEGIERSSYQISAGSAIMLVKSSNFWAEKTEDDRVYMANYSGITTVTAENTEIDLGKNQGTIVVRGRVPMPPIELLPSPRLNWAASDSVILRDQMTLRWEPVTGAVRYELDLSDSPSFDGWVRSMSSESSESIVTDIPTGISHLRIRAYDENNLRGSDSPTYRILRSTGMLPPYLFLTTGDLTGIYTTESDYTLTGVTEPGSILEINGESVPVAPSGDFEVTLALSDGQNRVVLQAANASGNITLQEHHITKITEKRLFDITWSSLSEDNRIRHADDILITGKAYPPLEVVARLGDKETVVPCGTNGNWALTLRPEQNTDLTIALRYRHNKEIIGERTYRIE